MARMRETDARKVLKEELERVGWDSVSAFTIGDGARSGTDQLDWWHERTPENERSDTLRNLAYLRAYVRIAASPRLYAGGIFLDRRRLWMDKSVISRLERDGYLSFTDDGREPYFEITKTGERFLSTGNTTPL